MEDQKAADWLGTLGAASSEYARETERASDALGKMNIVIGGNAGVGKSTLINAVFGQRLASTGVGRSQTMEIEAYTMPGKPVRIYDTRGFELRQAEQTVAAVKDKIHELRRRENADDQIHVAWLCILEQSHRIEPIHRSFLEMLREQNVPAVVIITQALGESEMESSVRDLAVPNSGVQPVLADERRIAGHIIRSHGIGELVEMTLRLLPEAHQNAFIAAQSARWDIKEAAAVASINAAATAAGASALIPVPGGHSAALLTIQIGMLADINVRLGMSALPGSREMISGMIGTMLTSLSGKMAFTLAMSELARFVPGVGWLGAAAVGGPIGATITKAFGHLYLDTVKVFARAGSPLPDPGLLADRMSDLLERNKAHYGRMASQ